MAAQISKKRKFVADGVFYAELNEVLTRELAEDGYSGVEVRVTPMRTEIIIRATRTQNVLGEKGRRIRELTLCSENVLSFLRMVWSFMLRKLITGVSVQLLRRVSSLQASWRPCCSQLFDVLKSITYRRVGYLQNVHLVSDGDDIL
uniref:KH type-2 domain-containing protein n=1 Tax=Populus alba TaxID=43335 RepID=A0A4U5M9P4_POPAL|nr:hypothetical protein D5086_0000317830 [Populus alba]